MSIDRFKMVVATHVFLIKKNQILLARRFQTGYEDGNFSVPAGHVDGNESVTEATIREAKEEVGVTIDPADLKFIAVFNRRTNRESIDFFFACEKWSGNPYIAEPNKCDLINWTDLQTLPQNTIGYIRIAVDAYMNKKHFLETTL